MYSNYSSSFTDIFASLPASVPTVSDLQSRIAELVEDLGHQNSTLTSAQQEQDRLQAVEADLSWTVQTLRVEITTLKASQTADLNAVAAAGDTLRAERDAVVA